MDKLIIKQVLKIGFVFIFAGSLFAEETVEVKMSELLEKLHRDGYHLEVFTDDRFEVYTNTQKAAAQMNKANYLSRDFGYYTDASFRQAVEFSKKYDSALAKAKKRYGVGREYIMAILQLESNFGKEKSRRKVFNALVSMYIYGRKWAYSEIKCYLDLKGVLYDDPYELTGSYAGAFGIAQALPASYRDFGVDLDNDGKIGAYDMDDAIGFVANYLKNCGFGKTSKSRRGAVYAYNHQKMYVEAIMQYAKELRRRLDSLVVPHSVIIPPHN